MGKYGIKGTFNLNYGLVGERPRMTFEEMKWLYAGRTPSITVMTRSVPHYGPMDMAGKHEKRLFRRSETPYGMDALPLICIGQTVRTLKREKKPT